MKTTTVGARELKTRLGTYLRRVRQGETLLVTERGDPVAEIIPVRPGGATDSLEARLWELVRAGVVSWGGPGELPPFEPIGVSGPPLSQAIFEDREDRF